LERNTLTDEKMVCKIYQYAHFVTMNLNLTDKYKRLHL